MASAVRSKVRKSKDGGCMLIGFFAIFAVAGAVMFYFFTVLPMWNIVRAQNWMPATCEIETSEVEVVQGSDGNTYRVAMTYSYDYEGQIYLGDRYDFSTGSSSGYDGKARVVEAHPPGSSAACWVDPVRPSRSVISRAPGWFLLWGLFPLPFLAIGVGGLAFALHSYRREKATGSRRQGLVDATPFDDPTHAESRQTERKFGSKADVLGVPQEVVYGRLDLEVEASPMAKMWGTLFFALFWNGIVSIFLFAAVIPGIRSGDIEWVPTLFMIPFVLVGLGAIVMVVYQFLASFNPRPHLTIEEGHLVPGRETSLRWELLGRGGRVKKLTIELEGKEEVRYQRGTSTYTDDHVFYEVELVAAEGRFSAVERGHVTLVIPEGTMPSFEAPNNKILWRLKLRGDVPMWPDVIADFPITVYPS